MSKKENISELRNLIEQYEKKKERVILKSSSLMRVKETLQFQIQKSIELFEKTKDDLNFDLPNVFVDVKSDFLDYENKLVKLKKEFKQTQGDNIKAGATIATGAAVAVGGPAAIMAIATTFGTASTGATIASLGGAAATNAALAWLGGGALAAGGGGTALGATILGVMGPIGWGIAGIGAAGLGIAGYKKNKDDIEKIQKEISLINKSIKVMDRLSHNVTKLEDIIDKKIKYLILHSDRMISTPELIQVKNDFLNSILSGTELLQVVVDENELALEKVKQYEQKTIQENFPQHNSEIKKEYCDEYTIIHEEFELEGNIEPSSSDEVIFFECMQKYISDITFSHSELPYNVAGIYYNAINQQTSLMINSVMYEKATSDLDIRGKLINEWPSDFLVLLEEENGDGNYLLVFVGNMEDYEFIQKHFSEKSENSSFEWRFEEIKLFSL